MPWSTGGAEAPGAEPVDEAWVAPLCVELAGALGEALTTPLEDPEAPVEAVDGPEPAERPAAPAPPLAALDTPPRAAAVSGDTTDPPAAAPLTGVGDTWPWLPLERAGAARWVAARPWGLRPWPAPAITIPPTEPATITPAATPPQRTAVRLAIADHFS